MDNIIKELEDFICSGDLDDLEAQYNNFNIFDCVGMSKQEIRHSNFLSWLFNPKENHGMEDFFVKEFLKKVISENSDKTSKLYELPNVFDIDSWDLSNIIVLRENDNMDIKLINNSTINPFICVIENKIKAKQGNNQLSKYLRKIIEDPFYKKYKKLFLYLKPEENEKIDKEYIYVPYSTIVEILDKKLLPKKSNCISPNILLVIKNYIELLRRDIMDDEEIKQICERIYSSHRKAIDTIIDYVDTGRNESQIAVAKLVNEYITNKGFKFKCNKDNYRNISFIPLELEKYENYFRFRIWNAVMKGEFSLKVDFSSNDFDIQQRISSACNKSIKKCQQNTVICTILNKKECEKLCADFDKENELIQDWKEKIINNIESALNKIDYEQLDKI